MGYQLNKEVMKMLFYVFYISLVSIVILIGGSLFLNQKSNIDGLENSLVVSRLLYSENCLAVENNVGAIDSSNFYSDKISECSGINENSKQGLRLRLKDSDGNVINEVEINGALTSQCIIANLKNIREDSSCSYSKYYVSFEDKKGVLEILVANDIKK